MPRLAITSTVGSIPARTARKGLVIKPVEGGDPVKFGFASTLAFASGANEGVLLEEGEPLVLSHSGPGANLASVAVYFVCDAGGTAEVVYQELM